MPTDHIHLPIPDDFPGIPPFPLDVPTVPLVRLSLAALHANDVAESARLFSASKALGFFYLDLRDDPQGSHVLLEADELFQIGEKLFDLGREELSKYDYSEQNSYYGYKGYGRAYTDEKGNLDRNEYYNAGKDDFLDQSSSPFAHPPLLHSHRSLLRSYMLNAHSLVTLLLTNLTTHLDLPPGTLTSLNNQASISGDHIRFIKAPPQPPDDRRTAMGQHTDFGSLTILFNRLGGLQVLMPPDADASDAAGPEWRYVKPLPGHCIVNLGDAMVRFTNGLLRSSVHRVVAPPGEQARFTRYALVYFARPGDDVLLKKLQGGNVIPRLKEGGGKKEEEEEVISSREHIQRMAMGRRLVGKTGVVPRACLLSGGGGKGRGWHGRKARGAGRGSGDVELRMLKIG